ncbi:MAG: helix-turn-helix transcriptional regulator [Synechococcales cyanobacterium CRU_2_2]|nr:helix-turn-helix transcriptional regulator [Synechococcales cyanobacterium CRU_2_2]
MGKTPLEVLQELVFGQVRQQGSVSQRAAASAVGVSKDAVGAWENMQRLPTPEYAERLAGYLGVHVVEFWAKIYSYPIKPAEEGDRTWPEIGATLTDAEFEELACGMPDDVLFFRVAQLSAIAARRFHSWQNTP